MADFIENDIENGAAEAAKEQNTILTFDEKVIKKIAGFSVSDIPGILGISGSLFSGLTDMFRNADDPTKGISVEVGTKQVSVNIKVICEYGRNLPAIFDQIVERINDAMSKMTGLEVVEIKVHVHDVLTKEDFERQNKKLAEEKTESISEESGNQ